MDNHFQSLPCSRRENTRFRRDRRNDLGLNAGRLRRHEVEMTRDNVCIVRAIGLARTRDELRLRPTSGADRAGSPYLYFRHAADAEFHRFDLEHPGLACFGVRRFVSGEGKEANCDYCEHPLGSLKNNVHKSQYGITAL